MKVKDLIMRLQFAVDELGFNPDTHIQIDMFDSNEDIMTYWNIELDDTAISEPKSLCINVFEEMQDEIL
tara:strand:- start:312 stop:518 length:207 start_codon:yes stop_codon:yes gene_type:complete